MNAILQPSIAWRVRVHIVILAWLFVTLTMALTFRSALAGAAFFVAAGVMPVALYAWLAVRRRRGARRTLR